MGVLVPIWLNVCKQYLHVLLSDDNVEFGTGKVEFGTGKVEFGTGKVEFGTRKVEFGTDFELLHNLGIDSVVLFLTHGLFRDWWDVKLYWSLKTFPHFLQENIS